PSFHFYDTSTTALHTPPLHDALPIYFGRLSQEQTMTQYLIEREIAGAGDMSEQALRDASKHSNSVLAQMSPEIQWVHSYVAGDKDRKSTRLNSSHVKISYAVFCLKKK